MAKSKQTDKEAAEQEAKRANERLHAIRDAERFAENKALAGKCFKFRNSYSCPEKASDYWWLYAKVQKVDEAGHLTVFQFETDKYGNETIKRDWHAYHMSGHTPISAAEFNRAWKTFQKRIAQTAP